MQDLFGEQSEEEVELELQLTSLTLFLYDFYFSFSWAHSLFTNNIFLKFVLEVPAS